MHADPLPHFLLPLVAKQGHPLYPAPRPFDPAQAKLTDFGGLGVGTGPVVRSRVHKLPCLSKLSPPPFQNPAQAQLADGESFKLSCLS